MPPTRQNEATCTGPPAPGHCIAGHCGITCEPLISAILAMKRMTNSPVAPVDMRSRRLRLTESRKIGRRRAELVCQGLPRWQVGVDALLQAPHARLRMVWRADNVTD